MLGRPILTLKIKSMISPCFTTQQDNTAMDSINTLSNITITYHDTFNESKVAAAASGVGKLVSGLFGGKNSNNNKNNNDTDGATSTKKEPKATMTVVDTIRGPVLSIEYIRAAALDDNDDDDDNDNVDENKAVPKPKTITLKCIGEITPNDSFMSSSSGISLYSKKKHKHDEQKELCRIDLMDTMGNDLGSDERDEVIEALKMLIQWDTERRASQPHDEAEDDEEDEGEGRSSLGQRALKMKHFATREIELKKVKKDREDRKARYLKDSGGLRYTAIAMANREMS